MIFICNYHKVLPLIEPFSTSLMPIKNNLKLGDPCGPCRCPPHFNLGNCAPGLKCAHETEYLDAPGTCVRPGKCV